MQLNILETVIKFPQNSFSKPHDFIKMPMLAKKYFSLEAQTKHVTIINRTNKLILTLWLWPH